jgi:RNA polymerase sigma factor (sigma-70 family)
VYQALRPLLTHVRRLAVPVSIAPESDGELLDRFVRRCDEDAFAALVDRHGPMVLRVCRRVLGDEHAAEDAFQACFLVLARRARSIRQSNTLAAWLHSVAARLAFRLRAAAGRRPSAVTGQHADPADTHLDPLAALTARELLAAVDEEIARLPENYQLPVLLCCVEGLSQEEVAARLGWTAGSLKGRLERGRRRLHARLTRRGLTLAAALSAVEAARGVATAECPARLGAAAVKAVLAFAGPARAASEIPDAARLASEFIGGAEAVKAKTALVVLFVLGLTALGAATLTQSGPGEPKATPPAGQPDSPKVEAKAHLDREGFPLPAEAVARVGSARFRGGGSIAALGYVADGRMILVVHRGGRVQLCDAVSGALRQPVELATDFVRAAAWHPDGKRAVLYSRGACHGLDLSSGKLLFKRQIPEGALASIECFSPDGSLIALAARDGTIPLIETETGKEKCRIRSDTPRTALAFSPDGASLAVGSDSPNVAVFDVATGKRQFELPTGLKRVSRLAFSPGGKHLLCGQDSPAAGVLIDVTGRKELSRLDLTKENAQELAIASSAFSPDDRYLALGRAGGVNLYETASGKHVRKFASIGGAFGIAFTPDSKTLLMGGGFGELSQWDVASGKLLPESSDPDDNFAAVRFVDGSKHLLVAAGQYIVYDWKAGRPVYRYPGPRKYFRSSWQPLAPDGSLMALSRDKQITLLDTRLGQERWRLAQNSSLAGALAFSADSRLLFVAESGKASVLVVDVATGETVRELKGEDQQFYRMAVSPDGRWLASSAINPSTRAPAGLVVWDVASGRPIHRLEQRDVYCRALAFSPTCKELAIALEQINQVPVSSTVTLIDVPTGRIKRSFAVPQQLMTMAYSPEGRTLAIGAGEGSLRLWEVASGQPRYALKGHRLSLHALVYAPDGAFLAASSYDAPTFVWDVYGKHTSNTLPTEKALATAGDRLWAELAGSDTEKALAVVRQLVHNAGPALALLRAKLPPAEPVDVKRLSGWLKDLDNDDFSVRKTSFTELEKRGADIEGHLRKAIEAGPTVEAKRRLESLLANAEAGPDRLRQSRALEALEQIATPEAVQLLESLAQGEPAAHLTREAEATLGRLRKR